MVAPTASRSGRRRARRTRPGPVTQGLIHAPPDPHRRHGAARPVGEAHHCQSARRAVATRHRTVSVAARAEASVGAHDPPEHEARITSLGVATHQPYLVGPAVAGGTRRYLPSGSSSSCTVPSIPAAGLSTVKVQSSRGYSTMTSSESVTRSGPSGGIVGPSAAKPGPLYECGLTSIVSSAVRRTRSGGGPSAPSSHAPTMHTNNPAIARRVTIPMLRMMRRAE